MAPLRVAAIVAIAAFAGGHDLVAQQPPRPAPADLTVRCVGAGGEPVADAEVHVFEVRLAPKVEVTRLAGPLRSGADGGCAPVPIANVATWREHWVYARVPDRLVGMLGPGLMPRDAGAVVVRLGPARRVTGTVRAPAGVDVAAARVRVVDLSEPGTGPAGPTPLPTLPTSRDALLDELRRVFPGRFDSAVAADGTFRLDEVPAALALHLAADGPGLAHTQWRSGDAGTEDRIEVAVPAEAVFGGTVATPDCRPAAGATVVLQLATLPAARRGLQPTRFAATTGSDGRFELRGLPAGEFVLRVEAEGACRYPQPVALAAAERRAAETLQLESGVEVAGVVRSADDEVPVASVALRIAGDAAPYPEDLVLARVRTDADGRFVARVPKGPAWLTASPRRPFVRPEPQALDLMRPAGELRQLEILLRRR